MNRSVLVGLVACIFAVTLVGASGSILAIETGSEPTFDHHASVDGGQAFEEITSREFDSTTFEITVHDNGTATWTFRHERILSDESEQAEFEAFAEEFQSEETDFYLRFTQQAQALVDRGADETGREMDATAFNRSATVEQGLNVNGIVEMSFQWTAFSTTNDDGEILIGDVFDGGFPITDDQTLVVAPEGDLVFSTVSPEPEYTASSLETAETIAWSGEREFLDGQPHVVLEQPPGDEGEDATTTPADDERSSTLLLVAGLLVVGGLGGAIFWYRYRAPDEGGPPGAGADPAAAEHSDRAATETDAEPFSATELLTDEDRVIALIRENGGRMKQVNIVDETGWSKSKVSMLLSDMEADGTISKLRVGRENIISLEGYEPEAAKSPFDE